jgi:cellulose synthase/poly-beta-1,6-N-acetylglucosamine synthase-like glycosyltransferase
MALDLLAFAFGLVHFSVPLVYYGYLKRCLRRPWNVKVDGGYQPRVTVIVPTYNEASLIVDRLENLKGQDYLLEKIEVVVVDSGSTDGTASIAKSWGARNPDVKVAVVEEPVRMGKTHALNTALKCASSDVVVLADADSLWARDALREALKYFSDPSVGAVTAVKEPVKGSGNPGMNSKMESTYRLFYNDVRVGESRVHSTPVFHGELAAFRRDLLFEVGGFPSDVGADDSHAATLIALRGHRAIAAPEVRVYELSPNSWNGYAAWRGRRAKHLVQHFSRSSKKLFGAPKGFRSVLAVESFLHLVNPWLLLVAFTSFVMSIAIEGFSLLNMLVMLVILAALLVGRVREALLTWVVSQVVLVYSAVAGVRSKELTWKKIEDLRKSSDGRAYVG